MDIKKDISSELKFDAELDGATAKISLGYGGKLGGAKFEAYISAVELVDKITDLIPGELDDALIDNAVAKLLTKKTNAEA